MIWTVALGGERCGSCGGVFTEFQPLALVTSRKLMRCQPCAGAPVDQTEVANEHWRIERDRAAAAPVAPTPPYRHQPSRGVTRASELADLFDPQKAAANDRD